MTTPPKKPSMPRVILARHGETDWSISGQHTGRTDLHLTSNGEQVMLDLAPTIISTDGNKLVDLRHVSHIFTSPRFRSRRTLDLMLTHLTEQERLDMVKPQVRQDCREWDYGAYEGLKTHEIRSTRPNWNIWVDGTPDSTTDPANFPGESAASITSRIDNFISEIKSLQKAVIEGHASSTHDPEVIKRGGDIIVVAHGHYNRCFIARWLGLDLPMGRLFEVDAGGVAVLTYTHSSFDEPAIGGIFSSKTGPKPSKNSKNQKELELEHEETQYLSLVSKVIQTGEFRADRTGTGTLALFAPTPNLRFSLRNHVLPLLTTKRVFTRGVLEELLWFVAGKTDGKLLTDRRVHIWDGNGSKEFLESRGLGNRREGDLGPVYGFQWRHFGATYKDCETDYKGKGVDQLEECIRKIKENPTDRRIILSAWNPADLDLMALPPCHMFCQFFVSLPPKDSPTGTKPLLSCQMYQRSCDLGLGVPFNIASYAMLTHMIAHVTGTEANELILSMGDAHVYKDHVEPLKTQLERTPREFPTLKFNRQIPDIDSFKYEDFLVENYNPMGKIEMKMSV